MKKRISILNVMKVLCLLWVIGLAYSCQNTPKKDPYCGKWLLDYSNNNNWSRQLIICDSCKMVSLNEATYWINGTESALYAQFIYPMFQPCQ